MFCFGDSFEESLKDAQEKGYAERNPDADILGTDACRKISILGALISGKLIPTDLIHTEGITGIRKEDVITSEKIGLKIKLLGRCIVGEEGTHVMVAPFMMGEDSPLSSVSGVYNAVEVIGEPIKSAMFYGPGAGAGPTASAVVGDLMQIMRQGANCALPEMRRTADGVLDFDSFSCKSYVAVLGGCRNCVKDAFGAVEFIETEKEIAFITERMSESDIKSALAKLTAKGIEIKSRIRLI